MTNQQNGTSTETRVKVPAEVSRALRSAVQAFGRAGEAQQAAKEAQAGGYVQTVQAAILATTAPVFEAGVNQLWAEIRRNVGGIAVTLGAKKGKKEYTVPSGARSAVSVMRAAFEHDIPMSEGKNKPRSFTAIRDDVREAQAEALRANLPEGYVAIQDAADALRECSERLNSLADYLKDDSEALAYYRDSVKALADTLDHHEGGRATAKAEAEKAGEALAAAEAEADKPQPKQAAA